MAELDGHPADVAATLGRLHEALTIMTRTRPDAWRARALDASALGPDVWAVYLAARQRQPQLAQLAEIAAMDQTVRERVLAEFASVRARLLVLVRRGPVDADYHSDDATSWLFEAHGESHGLEVHLRAADPDEVTALVGELDARYGAGAAHAGYSAYATEVTAAGAEARELVLGFVHVRAALREWARTHKLPLGQRLLALLEWAVMVAAPESRLRHVRLEFVHLDLARATDTRYGYTDVALDRDTLDEAQLRGGAWWALRHSAWPAVLDAARAEASARLAAAIQRYRAATGRVAKVASDLPADYQPKPLPKLADVKAAPPAAGVALLDSLGAERQRRLGWPPPPDAVQPQSLRTFFPAALGSGVMDRPNALGREGAGGDLVWSTPVARLWRVGAIRDADAATWTQLNALQQATCLPGFTRGGARVRDVELSLLATPPAVWAGGFGLTVPQRLRIDQHLALYDSDTGRMLTLDAVGPQARPEDVLALLVFAVHLARAAMRLLVLTRALVNVLQQQQGGLAGAPWTTADGAFPSFEPLPGDRGLLFVPLPKTRRYDRDTGARLEADPAPAVDPRQWSLLAPPPPRPEAKRPRYETTCAACRTAFEARPEVHDTWVPLCSRECLDLYYD